MSRVAPRTTRPARLAGATKYDAHHTVLSKTYGALADLRRELSDSKTRVAEREELLKIFAGCADSQRAWLLLEDYFEKLSLSRKDFGGREWWPRVMGASGKARLEEVAILFLRANRPVPTELVPYANVARFAEIEQAEQEQAIVQQLEHWLSPPAPTHLDSPRALLRAICEVQPTPDHPALHCLVVRLNLYRPRTGEKFRPLAEIMELTARAAHEQELFSPPDWEFIQWLAEIYGETANGSEAMRLTGVELLQWLARWGESSRLEVSSGRLEFAGEIATLAPHLENGTHELSFVQKLALPGGALHELKDAKFFAGRPSLALVGHRAYLLRNAPPPSLLEHWSTSGAIPVRKLSHRLLTQLRKTHASDGIAWQELCVTHTAVPQFVFELNEDTVRLRLLARSDRNERLWHWN